MKANVILMALVAVSMFLSNPAKAQAFGGDGSIYVLGGIGINYHHAIFFNNNIGFSGGYTPRSTGLNLQVEYGIHEYIGVGAFAGIDFITNFKSGILYPSNAPNYVSPFGSFAYKGVAIPIGIHGNFHFLKLIADNAGENFEDDLDVYAGLSIGTGITFLSPKRAMRNSYPSSAGLGSAGFMIFGGGHVGVRYFTSPDFGFFAELGYGKSVFQGGIVMKL